MLVIFKTAFSVTIQSISFSIPYIILGSFVDYRMFIVYTLLYPFQCLGSAISSVFENIGIRSIVVNNGSHNSIDEVKSRNLGRLLQLIYVIISIPLNYFLVDVYINYLGLDAWYIDTCRLASLSISCYFTVWLFGMFEDICGKHKTCAVYSIAYLSVSTFCTLLTLLFDKGVIWFSKMSLCSYFILIALLCYQNRDMFYNINIKHIYNAKYSTPSAINSSIVAVIYLLCSVKASLAGNTALTSISTVIVFFDFVWDSQYSIIENYNRLAENGNKINALYKTLLPGVFETLTMISLSIFVMCILGVNIFDGDILLLIMVEFIALFLYSFYELFKAYLFVSYSIKVCSILFFIAPLFRLSVTYITPSAYASEISLIFTALLFLPIMYMMFNHSKEGIVYG